MYEIPSMFIYNAVCVMSDLTTSKAGTITSGEDRFMEWKTTDGSYENTQHASFDTFFVGLFEKTRFLDIVKNFICFNVDGQNTFKILAGYHIRAALCRTAGVDRIWLGNENNNLGIGGGRPPDHGTHQASKQSADVHASGHAEAVLAADGAPDA